MKEREQKQNFGKFLMQRFFMIILGIMLGELVLMFLYNSLLFPWLSEFLDGEVFRAVKSQPHSIGSMVTFVFFLVVSSLMMLLPGGIGKVLQNFFFSRMPAAWKQSFQGISVTGQDHYQGLVYLGYFAIGVLLLVVLMAPFAVGAWLYSQMIRQEVGRLMVEDQRKTREEQQRRNMLLSDIAHDLKTPMTTVAGYAQALRDGIVEDPGKQREYLNSIEEKTQRMNQMVELLLDYSRLESGGLTLQLQERDVAEWLRELVAECYEELEEAGIALILDISEEEYLYAIDPLQFGRVVLNLVGNARKHMETGTHILIRLSHVEGRDGFRLTVGDDGISIPDDLAEHLFDPFVMGDASRNSRGGSGLGLSIAAQITKLHGGKIWLDTAATREYTKAFVIEIYAT